MNYYIQGDAAKAEQIKAAFEKLGYEKVNVLHIGDYANERLFFFTVNGHEYIIMRAMYSGNIIHSESCQCKKGGQDDNNHQ